MIKRFLFSTSIIGIAIFPPLVRCEDPSTDASLEAETEPSTFALADSQQDGTDENSGEETRKYISDSLFSLTDEIDSWFDDARSEEQRQDDWIRLSSEVRFRDSDPVRFRQRIRAGFNLKEFSDRLRLVIEGDNGDAFENGQRVDDTPEIDDFIKQNNRDGGSAAIRYYLYRDAFAQLSADAGMRFSGGPNPFARLRGSYWFQLSELWSFEPSQLFFQEKKDGFGERTRFDINRLIDKDKFIRIRSEGLHSDESRGIEYYEELSYLTRLPYDRSLSTSLAMFAYNDPANTVDKVRSSFRYRTPLLGDWLYGVIEPGLEFPDDRNYRTTPYVIFRLEGLFTRPNQAYEEQNSTQPLSNDSPGRFNVPE